PPVCRACHDFLLLHTAFKNGSSAGIPSADATTENARAVVLRTYSSVWSISGRIVAIIVASPAAFDRLLIISRPSTRAYGPAPYRRAFSLNSRSPDRRCCGVPFFTFNRIFLMSRSLISSVLSFSCSCPSINSFTPALTPPLAPAPPCTGVVNPIFPIGVAPKSSYTPCVTTGVSSHRDRVRFGVSSYILLSTLGVASISLPLITCGLYPVSLALSCSPSPTTPPSCAGVLNASIRSGDNILSRLRAWYSFSRSAITLFSFPAALNGSSASTSISSLASSINACTSTSTRLFPCFIFTDISSSSSSPPIDGTYPAYRFSLS
ncbi:hypothetical protein AX774_g1655, partial [Zancudomyces culisetae]